MIRGENAHRARLGFRALGLFVLGVQGLMGLRVHEFVASGFGVLDGFGVQGLGSEVV